MNLTLTHWATTNDAVLVNVYAATTRLGTLAFPKALWQEMVEASKPNGETSVHWFIGEKVQA